MSGAGAGDGGRGVRTGRQPVLSNTAIAARPAPTATSAAKPTASEPSAAVAIASPHRAAWVEPSAPATRCGNARHRGGRPIEVVHEVEGIDHPDDPGQRQEEIRSV